MSTVLRPVGPEGPQTYWVRRGLVIGIPLILILVIAVSCSGGGGGKPAARNTPGPTVSHPPAAAQPCTAAEIDLTLSADKKQYAIGESPKLVGKFTNVGSSPCTLTYSPSNEDWTVTSGQTQIWTTKGCPAKTSSNTVTLQASGVKKRSITWAGKQYSNCQPSGDLQNGEYVLRATLDGFTAKAGAVFQMTASTGG